MERGGAAASIAPAFLVISIPDPHPSEGGYVTRSPYNRLFRNSSSAGANFSTMMPASYWDAAPLVSTDVKPFAQRQREITAGRWRAQHLHRVLRLRQAFAGMTTIIDDCVGELVSRLQASVVLENTLIVFTSDHGDLAGAHGLRGKSARQWIFQQTAITAPRGYQYYQYDALSLAHALTSRD